MDVAPWVPDDFWREWRSEIKRHKPDALTIAETWFDASKFFLGDTFDSTMNYIFRNTVIDYANGGDARKLYRNIELMREAYPPQAFYALMNLISSHDVPRALHLFGYTSETTDAAKIAEAKQRLLLAAFFQMVFPGAPAIYYGDEVGLTGGEDPFNRAPYPWADEGGKPDVALLHQFRELASLRRQHAVLRHGSLQAPLAADAHTLALIRHHHGETALTLMNNDVQPKQLTLHLPADAATTYRDALTGATVHATGGSLVLKVPALFGRVLLSH
jgi:glycosidase